MPETRGKTDGSGPNTTYTLNTELPEEMEIFFYQIVCVQGPGAFLDVVRNSFCPHRNLDHPTYSIDFITLPKTETSLRTDHTQPVVVQIPSVQLQAFDTHGTFRETDFQQGLQRFAEYHLLAKYGADRVRPDYLAELQAAIEEFEPREN